MFLLLLFPLPGGSERLNAFQLHKQEGRTPQPPQPASAPISSTYLLQNQWELYSMSCLMALDSQGLCMDCEPEQMSDKMLTVAPR